MAHDRARLHGGADVRTYRLEDWAARLSSLLTHADKRIRHEMGRRLSGRLQAHARRLAPVKTGALRRSLVSTYSVRERRIRLTSTVPYARIQSTGGRIFPRTRRYLAVPIGHDSGPPAQHGRHAVATGRDGRLYLVQPGTSRIRYVLRSSVYLRGSRYLDRAVAATTADLDDVTREVATVLRDLP